MTATQIKRAVLVSLLLATAIFIGTRHSNANASANRGGGRNSSINHVIGY